MKLCPLPSGLSQALCCEVAAVQQKHYEIFTLMQACKSVIYVPSKSQSPVPFKLIHNWWRAHFRELDASSEDKELLPTCVHSCSLRANKVPRDPRIDGKYGIWDHALEPVE